MTDSSPSQDPEPQLKLQGCSYLGTYEQVIKEEQDRVFPSFSFVEATGSYSLPSVYCHPLLVISSSFSNTAKLSVGQQLLFNQNHNA